MLFETNCIKDIYLTGIFLSSIFLGEISMIEKFLKELAAKGLKQEEIQKLTGLTQGYISRLSRGAKPSLETVIKLAEVFEVTTDEVLGRKQKP